MQTFLHIYVIVTGIVAISISAVTLYSEIKYVRKMKKRIERLESRAKKLKEQLNASDTDI